jgi:hypothetical protein
MKTRGLLGLLGVLVLLGGAAAPDGLLMPGRYPIVGRLVLGVIAALALFYMCDLLVQTDACKERKEDDPRLVFLRALAEVEFPRLDASSQEILAELLRTPSMTRGQMINHLTSINRPAGATEAVDAVIQHTHFVSRSSFSSAYSLDFMYKPEVERLLREARGRATANPNRRIGQAARL